VPTTLLCGPGTRIAVRAAVADDLAADVPTVDPGTRLIG
jgi:hypothetical protein